MIIKIAIRLLKAFEWIGSHKLLVMILLLGLITPILVLSPNGSYYCIDRDCGIFFWGIHRIDAIWHLAVINSAFNSFPPRSPIFAGEPLRSYNFGIDVIIFVVAKLITSVTSFGLPQISSLIFFKLTPIVWFGLTTHAAWSICKKLQKSYYFLCFFLLFLLYGTSFYFHLDLLSLGDNHLRGDVNSSAANMLNVPLAMSIPMLLYAVRLMLSKQSIKRDIALAVLMAGTLAVKFYSGIIIIIVIGCYFVLESIHKGKVNVISAKRLFSQISVLILFFSGVIVAVYRPLRDSSSMFIFDPFKTMDNPIYDIFMHFGTRVLGFIEIARRLVEKKIQNFEIALLIGIIFGVVVPIMFVQRGLPRNSLQFLSVSITLMAYFAALCMDRIISNSKRSTFIIFAVLLISLPHNIAIMNRYALNKPNAFIPTEEIEALDFLLHQPHGVVGLEYYKVPESYKPIPLPLYVSDTPYVTAYSNKISYVVFIHNLDNQGYFYEDRIKMMKSYDALALDNIDYLYKYNDPNLIKFKGSFPIDRLDEIFRNNTVTIYRVK